MFDRDQVFATDVAEAIERLIAGIPGNNPKALRILEATLNGAFTPGIANELARMKFEQPDDNGVVRIPRLPAGVIEKYASEYAQRLDPIEHALLSNGYEAYAEQTGTVIVPVSIEFFHEMEGQQILDCLGGMSAKEAQRSLPRRNNPTVGIVVFDGENAHTAPLVALWYMRQQNVGIGQQEKLIQMREALPRIAAAAVSHKLPKLVYKNGPGDEE